MAEDDIARLLNVRKYYRRNAMQTVLMWTPKQYW